MDTELELVRLGVQTTRRPKEDDRDFATTDDTIRVAHR